MEVMDIAKKKKDDVSVFWEEVMNNEDVELKDRIKVSELLAKQSRPDEKVSIKIKVEYQQ